MTNHEPEPPLPVDFLRARIEGGGAEIDHSINILLNRGRRLTWREVNAIRIAGYRIQDVTFPEKGGDDRVKVRCVRDGDNWFNEDPLTRYYD